jgi:hypothetical protein
MQQQVMALMLIWQMLARSHRGKRRRTAEPALLCLCVVNKHCLRASQSMCTCSWGANIQGAGTAIRVF